MKLKITLPESFADVSVRKYITMIDAWDSYPKAADKVKAAVSVLCNMKMEHLDMMSVASYEQVAKGLMWMMDSPRDGTKGKPHKFVTIDGIKYGFIPDWTKLTLAEFADLESYATGGFFENLNCVLAIVYRPVTEEVVQLYEIEPYEPSPERKAAMNDCPMDVAVEAMVFFYNIAETLLSNSEYFLKKVEQKAKTNRKGAYQKAKV